MRLVAVATVVLAFAVSTMACSAGAPSGGSTTGGQTGSGGNGGAGGGATNGATAGNGGGTTSGATCDDACALYLGCKGIDSTDNRTACDNECTRQNHSQEELSQFVALDCQTAVALIDPPPSNNQGGSGGSSGSSCDRCVWDGSSCIWMSPNAPVTPACDASCCPGH
jgi:hypothetical protein